MPPLGNMCGFPFKAVSMSFQKDMPAATATSGVSVARFKCECCLTLETSYRVPHPE